MFFGFESKRKTGPKNGPIGGGLLSMFSRPVAGVRVDENTAWRFSAFFACVRIKSETIAYLPWHVYERGGSKQNSIAHPVDDLLYLSPNDELTPFHFKELICQEVEAHGNSYWEIVRNRAGEPLEAWSIERGSIEPARDSRGRLVYEIANSNTTLMPRDVLHARGPSYDGILGRSIIDIARESISLGLAANAFGASFLGNGAMPSLVISDPERKAKLDEDGVKNLKRSWRRENGGASRQNGVEYLDAGLKVEALGLTPEQTQFIQTADYSIVDMCRWFRIPPHKLAKLEKATWNNIESQNTEFVTDAIMPLCSRLEGVANQVLLGRSRDLYTKFNIRGLLRGDSTARVEYYKELMQLGVMTINDVLDAEDMDRAENGDTRLVSHNLVTLERAIRGQSAGEKSAGKVVGSLIREAAQRVCRVESSKLKKVDINSSTDDIQKIYVSLCHLFVDAFRNVALAYLDFAEKKIEDHEAFLKLFFSGHCSDSADQFYGALLRGEEKELLLSWQKTKPDQLTDKFISALREA